LPAQVLGDLRGLLAAPDPDAYSTRTHKARTSRHPAASVQAAVRDPTGGEDGLVLEELVQAADREAVFAAYGSERRLGVRKVTDVLGGRRALERAQSGRAVLRETDDERMTVPGGPTGGVPVRIIPPRDTTAVLPVVLYLHGPGWVFGSASMHDWLMRELAVGADTAVVFPEYTRSPEAPHPVARGPMVAVWPSWGSPPGATWPRADSAGQGAWRRPIRP
jgi:acetyl esterase/lipase